MELPNDMKDYSADDPFQLLTPDMCVVLLCLLSVAGYVFRDYLRIW